MSFLGLHLSYSAGPVDGGISVAVSELIAAQKSMDLTTMWLAEDSITSFPRAYFLRRRIQNLNPDILHIHGLWRTPSRIAPSFSCTHPYVIAPHGMLDSGALAISRHKKQFLWHLCEHRALQSAHCLHALCDAEAVAIRSLLPNVPIAVIPNGVDLPQPSDVRLQALAPWADDIPVGEPVLMFLGRFHHKKGLDPLLTAWQAIAHAASRHSFWLALVGYGDDGALAQRVAQAQAHGELVRVRVYGPAFGAEKAAALAAARAFVLPSFSEGLPMAALEAMAHQLPCLLSGACNLPEAFQVGAALHADPEPVVLSALLERFFKLSPAELRAMGRAGQALVRERFSWAQVAAQTRDLYSWVLGGGAPPSNLVLG